MGFAPGVNLGFALIKNGTADDILAGKTREIVFSTNSNSISNLSANGFDLNLEGIAVKIATSNTTRPVGVALQDDKSGEVLDLRELAGTVKVNFTVNREAAFNNYVGFYRVSDLNGGIDTNNDGVADILPGQAGYALAAVQRRISGIDLTVDNQGTASYTNRDLTGGSIFAPFIISNGTAQDILSGANVQVYFPYLGANLGNVDHIRLLGDNTFGFEDLPGGGDSDYNDVIVKVEIASSGVK